LEMPHVFINNHINNSETLVSTNGKGHRQSLVGKSD